MHLSFAEIKTYFIVGHKQKVVPAIPKPETVVVAIDGEVAAQSSEHDNLMNDTGKEVGLHLLITSVEIFVLLNL